MNKARYYEHLYNNAESEMDRNVYYRQMMKHKKRKLEAKRARQLQSQSKTVEQHIDDEDKKLQHNVSVTKGDITGDGTDNKPLDIEKPKKKKVSKKKSKKKVSKKENDE